MKLNGALLRGSLVLLISFNIYNALNFLFHLVMARMLSVAEYGILATLFSFMYMLGVFSESIQLVVAKYSAENASRGKIKTLLGKTLKRAFIFSFVIFIVYSVFVWFLTDILNINYYLLFINGFIIFATFLTPTTRGVMQGTKRFGSLGLNMISESLFKLIVAVVLVVIGYGVYGAILGTLVGVFISLIFSFYIVKDIFAFKSEPLETSGIWAQIRPTFFIILMIMAFYSLDIIFVRALFDEDSAGAYAIASVIAKMLFLGTYPVARAMFPLAVESNSRKQNSINLFVNAMSLIVFGAICALLVFYFLPELIVNIFSGKEISIASNLLFVLGISVSLISLSNLILFFKISIGRTKNYYIMALPVLAELVILYLFASSLYLFSIGFVLASIILLVVSILMK
ncbi:MAG: oligosaccharide flippase family protein [Nanoarchaeota archaeon]